MVNPLRAYLERNGIQQTDFAKRMGVTRAAVSGWIEGAYRPSLRAAVKIEEITMGAVTAAELSRWSPDQENASPERSSAA